jgi:sulfotransferase
MSSPVASLFDGIIAQISAGSELATMVNEEQRVRILRGLFDSHYADLDGDLRHQPRADRETSRADAAVSRHRLVGFPWHATREACYAEFSERVLILEYDLLTQRPAK